MPIEPYSGHFLLQILELSLRAWAPVFTSIEKAMDAEVYQHFHPDWRESQRKAVEAACTADDTDAWVALEDGGVVGFVVVKPHAEDDMGEIYMLAVDPNQQGRGIGTALMKYAMAWMKERGMAVAMVETGGDPGHAAARRTYEKLGFGLFPIARYFLKL
jgi:mycothiol synthase